MQPQVNQKKANLIGLAFFSLILPVILVLLCFTICCFCLELDPIKAVIEIVNIIKNK